ncbi:MAG: hypothetical protein WC565_03895 [Parcubacteria group bacterium]|jgi:hypothetical protein
MERYITKWWETEGIVKVEVEEVDKSDMNGMRQRYYLVKVPWSKSKVMVYPSMCFETLKAAQIDVANRKAGKVDKLEKQALRLKALVPKLVDATKVEER